LRSSIADFVVLQVLPPAAAAQDRYLCQPPERLGQDHTPVVVTELPVDAAGWRDLTSVLSKWAALPSTRLLSMYEVGPDLDPGGAGVYLVTEWAQGGSLADPEEPLDAGGKIRAVTDAARGAHALHEAGLAHGTIDGRSIFLTRRGAVLGPPALGRPPGALAWVRDWRDVVGMDPALLRGDEPSRSSDIWALGATLHTLLSDRPLYPGIVDNPPVTAVQRIMFTRPEIDASLPAAIAETISSCLAVDPAERPLTAEELADRLTAVEVLR
jgi:eukaryotic-like serine/threonine-protein kinase